MKKIVFGILLTFIFTVSITLSAQADGVEKLPQTQKVEKKKECKTNCDKSSKKECTKNSTKSTKKECCKKEAVVKK
jgi:hypothetical protein